jgi:hypothetical protein
VDGARTLAGLYEAAVTHGSVDGAQASAYRDHHLAHAGRLTTGPDAATDTTTTVAAAASSPTRASLAAAELSAGGTSAADIDAVSGPLAALLASIAACRALHAQALQTPALGHAQNLGSSVMPTLAANKSDDPSVSALQSMLSAENAVIFAFGALGPHLTGGQRASAHAAFDLHRNQRDVLTDAIAARGASPQAAEASYQLPFAVGDAAGACRLAALVETRLAAVCAEAVSVATGTCRTYAVWALAQAALRAQTWGTPITAFPGLST